MLFFVMKKLDGATSFQLYYKLIKFCIIFYAIPFIIELIITAAWIHPRNIPIEPATQSEISSMQESGSILSTQWAPEPVKLCLNFLFVIWVILFLIQITKILISSIHYYRYYRDYSFPANDGCTLALFQQICVELHIHRKVKIQICPEVHSPTIIGIVHPMILIPEKNFAEQDLYYILKHELLHYKNKDLLFKKLLLLLRSLYWFNPLMNNITYLFNEYCEFCCDNSVLASASNSERIYYANLIVSIAENATCKNCSPVYTASFSSKNELIRRIEFIMKKPVIYRNKKKAGILIALFFVMICPLNAYASTYGTLKAIHTYVYHSIYSDAETISNVITPVYEDPTFSTDNLILTEFVTLRGFSPIDRTLSPNNSAQFYITPTSNSISVLLSGIPKNSPFRATIVGFGISTQSINSSNGIIAGSFSVVPDRNYTIYIYNLSSQNIRIQGSIS